MPDKHVKILCHVEHVHPADLPASAGMPEQLAFGLTISVAVSKGFPKAELAGIKRLLQPWRWKISTIKVVTQSGKVIAPDPAVIRQIWQTKPVTDYRPQLAKRLEAEFTVCEQNFPEQFEWSVISQSYRHPKPGEAPNCIRPWHIVLAQAATWPAPFPQALNLSLIVRFPFPDQEPIYAVPTFELAGKTFTPKTDSFVDFDVDTGKPPDDSQAAATKKVKVCTYDNELVPGTPIMAYVDSCEVRKPAPSESLLDLYTYWIDPLSDFDKFDEDWRSQLEARMANAFDLSRRITEYLRNLSLKPSPGAEAIEEGRVGADLAISTLRDLTGIGINPGPNGQSLLERLLPQVKPGYVLDAARIETVRTAIVAKFASGSDPNSWQSFIKETIPATAGLKIISSPNQRLSLGEVVTELDQLYHLIFEPANLWTLVKEQWRLLKTPLALTDEELEKLAKLVSPAEPLNRGEPGRMDLRRQLAYENLGVFWRSFVRSKLRAADGKPLVKQSFACHMRAYCLLRFGKDLTLLAPGPQMPTDLDCVDAKATMDKAKLEDRYKNLKVVPHAPDPNDQAIFDQMLPKLLADIKTWTDTFDQTLVATMPGATPSSKVALKKSSTPHSVTLALDTISGEPNVTDPNAADPLSSISGVGVLMREPGKEWRCLNLATAEFTLDDAQVVPTTRPVLVPLRLSYRNELKQALINYSNHPLAAKSPAANLTAYHPLAPGDTPTLASVLTYRYSTDPSARLPSLKFGKAYEYLPFIIGNSGVVPQLLAAGDNAPCQIDLSKVDANQLTGKIRTFTHQRTAPIGSIRMFDTDGKACVSLPRIPDDVYPRARDMIIDSPATAVSEDSTPSIDSAPRTLVLLAPDPDWKNSVNKFEFTLRLPATDLVTWDHWIGGGIAHGIKKTDEEVKTLRVNIWTEYHKRLDLGAATSTTCGPPVPDHDASLDDPALAHLFRFELQEELGGARSKFLDARDITPGNNLVLPPLPTEPASPYTPSLRPAQSDLIKVTIIGVNTTPVAPAKYIDVVGDAVTIKVAKGKVYRLKLFCCLPVSAREANPVVPFADIWDKPLEEVTINGQRFYKVAPYEMLVEVATDCLGINESDCSIRQQLDSLGLSGPSDDEANRDAPLKVSFPAAGNPGFPYIYRVELQRQMWRWYGRETAPHPRVPPFDEWEAKEFGGRSDNDYLAVPMQATLTDLGDGSRTFQYLEHLSGPNVKEDLRALHYRFKARATSRYAGMLPSPEDVSTTWTSHFVPCRVRKQPPPPSVKLILPLTESFGSSGKSNTAGLILVLREPWHEVGGIGEGIEAEVVAYPDNKYSEFGADPIISGAAEAPNQSIIFDKIRGPIGHTFDRTLDAALFTSTSFIIPAPQVNGTQRDFSWNFCKLRFRRVIKVNPDFQLRSNFTEPLWVQYLPEFFLADMGATKFANLRLSLNQNNLLVVDGTSGAIATLQGQKVDPSAKAVFELYLVLTRRVFDATGRHDQEEYLGVYFRQGDVWARATSSTPRPDLQPSDPLLARIIEVQRRVSDGKVFTTEDAVWDALFDRSGKILDSQRARIVRISEPIPSPAAVTSPC